MGNSNGYTILPEQTLPVTYTDLESTISDNADGFWKRVQSVINATEEPLHSYRAALPRIYLAQLMNEFCCSDNRYIEFGKGLTDWKFPNTEDYFIWIRKIERRSFIPNNGFYKNIELTAVCGQTYEYLWLELGHVRE